MLKAEKLLGKYPLLIILLLSIPAILALLVPGFYGASDDLHIAWLQQMDKVIREGQIPPRFVPDLSYGFGYPLFNFVFPLPFYIAEVFHLLGFSLVDSIKILFGLSLPLSGYFMYKLLKEYAGVLLSLAGAVVYIYTPYRSTDIYVRGAIGEIVAFVFLPLIILAVLKITQKSKRGKCWVGILGLSTAALVMSHNIMAYMFFPFVLLFVVVKLFSSHSPRLQIFLKILAGLILGLLISVYFWLPAIVESSLLKYDTIFNFKDHFPTIKQLITPYFGYGASVAGPYDGMSFFMGTVNLSLIIVGILVLLIHRKKPKNEQLVIPIWAFLVFATSVFLMNHRSSFVWDKIPLIPYFQFPWRFLSMTTFVAPLFIILLQKFKYWKAIAVSLIVITIMINYSYYRPHDFLGRTDAYYLNRYIPYPVASNEYRQTAEEYLRLPKATSVRPSDNSLRVELSAGQIDNLKLVNSLDANFEVNSGIPAVVSYNKYLFPGWTVKVDDREIALGSGEPFGQIVFEVPAGIHNIEVKFRETNTRMVLNWISVLSFMATLGMIVGLNKKHESN